MHRLITALVAVVALATPAVAQVQSLAHVCTWLDTDNDSWSQVSTIPWRSEGLGVGYKAQSPTIIVAQAAEMKLYSINPLLSWWGPDVPRGGDGYLDVWRTVVTGLPAAILYEGEGRLRRDSDGWWTVDAPDNTARLRSDLTHLYEKYWSANPSAWYQRHGKFVVYLWPGHAMRGDLRAVLSALPFRERLYVVTTEFDALRLPDDTRLDMLTGVDAVTGYGFYSKPLMVQHHGKLTDELIAQYRFASLTWQEYLAAKLPAVELILPLELAFDDRNVPGRDNPVYEATPGQSLKLFAEMRQMIDHFWVHCGNVPPLITWVSYNEHFEGTAAEPSDRYGDQWLRLVSGGVLHPRLPMSVCQR